MLRDASGQTAEQAGVGDQSPRILACARCQRVIASTADRTEMNGSHEHTFVNPDNERFRIGCFSNATGLLRVGPASLEFTWFAGYSWQNEVCAGCRSFLGWLYRKGDHRFHGLVLDALVEIDGN
ncbi:MAG: hypothetical protein K1Y01_11530 [Vicinamibacteria bacterium]|nr:hypothetical protein [Vicinamibacteria bacterium]